MTETKRQPVILMTRAFEQGVAFASMFKARTGLDPDLIPAPVIQIEKLVDELKLPKVFALLFTSANAVRCFAEITEFQPYRALCVGKMTTAAARRAGYLASSADGALSELLEIATAKHMEGDLPYFYPRAEDVSGDLAGMLRERGTPCLEKIIYRQTAKKLGSDMLTLIEDRPVTVPIFSKFGGEAFLNAIEGITPKSVEFIAISAQVANSLPKQDQFGVTVAKSPSQLGMVEALSASLCAANP